MPRVVQTLNSSDLSDHLDIPNPNSNSGTTKMPDSSAGDSPRQQPAKPVRPALPSNRTVVPRALNFGPSDIVLDSDINENSENLEIRPKKIELPSRNFIKPQTNTSPKTKFTPKPGGLAEAALEVTGSPGSHTPVQRSNKWQKSESSSSKSNGAVRIDQLKEWQENGETNIPATNFYQNKRFSFGKGSPITYGNTKSLKSDKNRASLSEKEINNKINRTNHSTPKSTADEFRFITVDKDSESDKEKIIDLEPGPTQNILEVALPEKLDPHKIGFQNRGNTCYLNASLQALLGLPMVVTDATNIKYAVAKLAPKIESSRLVLPFTSLCLAQSRGEVGRANRRVVDLKSDMELVDNQFAGNKMQDANEFLCRFMDELKGNIQNLYEEVGDKSKLVLKDDADTPHTLTNLVDTNFLYEREEQFACCSCGAKSQSRHTDVSFFCDLSQSTLPCVPLQQLVQQTLAPEVRERRCEGCGCETATTTTRLVRLPKVLVLYLKRYKYSQSGPAPSRKVTRLVDIPETVNLSRLVSENVELPCNQLPASLIKSQSTASQVPPSTPTKKIPLPVPQFGTPIKFKGKTEEELMKLSEDDQTEYLLYISQKEALTSQGRETMYVNEYEDEDLKAALEASLLDVTENSVNMFDNEQKETPDKTDSADSETVFKTPLRKRHHSLSSHNGEPSAKIGRHGGGVFTHSTESLTTGKQEKINGTRRGDTPTPCERNAIGGDAPKAIEYFSSDETQSPKVDHDDNKTKSWKNSFHRPVTKAEEEADMLRALELSTQDMGCGSDQEDLTDDSNIAMDDTKNSNEQEVADDNSSVIETEPGPPEHSYKLSSVVSHFGASTSSGHYVADVYRFDAGGWFRYDDTVVTQTDQSAVR
eukprot:TRINITY_DN13579_c0_g1_i1.p1 TRINITY_DN13579_c0_g1~~TRINITY_DN13579_c0_g1_i1.p1  ORF type:complete len:874 (-),score=172.79 TRINITY_DN13579_c0_g1_i1:269-2890(-)